MPRVYAWDATVNNPVAAEYIIMEEVQGTQLSEVWDEMKISAKTSVVKDLVDIEKKLLSISFTRFVPCQAMRRKQH